MSSEPENIYFAAIGFTSEPPARRRKNHIETESGFVVDILKIPLSKIKEFKVD